MVNQAIKPDQRPGLSDILTSERLARTYANLLTSRPVLEETARGWASIARGLGTRRSP